MWLLLTLTPTSTRILAKKYGGCGFPMLNPRKNKDGEDYDSGRDLDDFLTFINEKCGTNREAKGEAARTYPPTLLVRLVVDSCRSGKKFCGITWL